MGSAIIASLFYYPNRNSPNEYTARPNPRMREPGRSPGSLLHFVLFHLVLLHRILLYIVLFHLVLVHRILRHGVLGHGVLFHVVSESRRRQRGDGQTGRDQRR